MYYDYCQGKSFSRVLSKFKTLFGRSISVQSHCFQVVRQFMSGVRTLENDDHCGRMAMTITPENISRVMSLIKKDPKMTYTEIQDIMKISSGSLTRIFPDCLGVKKCCACWVPHNLSEEQKQGRVDWCTHMLRKFDRGSPRI